MIIDNRSNELVDVEFKRIERQEISVLDVNRKSGWVFDWIKPFTESFEVFALVSSTEKNEIQGLISLKANWDSAYRCIDIGIIESAPWNKKYIRKKLNNNRKYVDVGKNLVAFACAYSKFIGLDGFVQLTSKTSKFRLYASLGGQETFAQQFMFNDIAANKIIQEYLGGEVKWWENR